MTNKYALALGTAVLLLAAGCSKPQGLVMQRLEPAAPAAGGLPDRPAPDQPSPLTERPPFGLYAEQPSSDTLNILATSAISPDGRFRSALTPQGVWVARVDGAWLWQVGLPARQVPVPPAKTPPGTSSPTPPTPPPTVTSVPKSVAWTPRSTLLIEDDAGRWLEANPNLAAVSLMPAVLQGREILAFSPDGKQVLYYVTDKTGRQLWSANADGSKPTFIGLNVTAKWDAAGKLVVTKLAEPTKSPAPTAGGGKD